MKLFKKLAIITDQIGLNPINTVLFFRGFPLFVYLYFKANARSGSWKINLFPILTDKYKEAGSLNSQYFFQDLYFSRLVYRSKPSRHLDIGSRIDGFVAQLLTFMNIDVCDIRSIESNIEGLHFRKIDIMSKDAVESLERYPSVSCLHTIEHFGLGRYGDSFNLDGWKTGLENLLGLVESDGLFYLSTPIGKKRIEFNAHRVFSPKELVSFVECRGFELISFEYLDDDNRLCDLRDFDFEKMIYGCGFFVFRKL